MKNHDRSVTTRNRVDVPLVIIMRRASEEKRNRVGHQEHGVSCAYVSMATTTAMGTIGCSNNNNDITMTRRM